MFLSKVNIRKSCPICEQLNYLSSLKDRGAWIRFDTILLFLDPDPYWDRHPDPGAMKFTKINKQT
jgi:hypothetical protein